MKILNTGYPDNRLALVVNTERIYPENLLWLSARFGVFMLKLGQWVPLDLRKYSIADSDLYSYFHLDMNEYKIILDMASHEDPGGMHLELSYFIEYEVAYEFEEPFWGYKDLGPEMPIQLRPMKEILDFNSGYLDPITEFNPAEGFNKSSEWAAHKAKDEDAVSYINEYASRVKKLRKYFVDFNKSEELNFQENMPPLNMFAQNLFDLTKYMYEDRDSIPEWAESESEDWLDRQHLEIYLTGEERFTIEELLNSCETLIKRHIEYTGP